MHRFILLALFISCSVTPGETEVTSIKIISENGTTLSKTEQTQLIVLGFDENGNESELTRTPLWSVSNENITLTNGGIAIANKVGTAVISANYKELTHSITLHVIDSTKRNKYIYVSDVGVERKGPFKIKKYDISGNYITDYITTNLSRPQDIVFIENKGEALISNLGSGSITRHDINTGEFKSIFAAELQGPTRIDIGPDGLLYVLQWDGGPVKRFNLNGVFIDDFTSVSITRAIGMAWDSNNNFYVSSWANGENGFVEKFNSKGIFLERLISDNLRGPTDIWMDENDDLYVNDWTDNNIKRFRLDGAFLGVFALGIQNPEGVAFLEDGSIIVGSAQSRSVLKYDSNGKYKGNIIHPESGRLFTPNAVVLREE